jgi:hypothetical protein
MDRLTAGSNADRFAATAHKARADATDDRFAATIATKNILI